MTRFFENFIYKALEGCYKRVKNHGPTIRLSSNGKYVVFSDHHKGGRNNADEFRQCEPCYLAALNWYFGQGYTLIILGDAEELIEESIHTVLSKYENVFRSEARFHHDKRYLKVIGNHDNKWGKEWQLRKHLHPILPGLKVHEGVLMEYLHPDTGEKGEILLVHGHQGTFESDKLRFLAKIVIYFYKFYQLLTNKGHTKPSTNTAIRAWHDQTMYLWATKKRNFVLIAGHTHRPVWCSTTHVEKLAAELREKKKQLAEIDAALNGQHDPGILLEMRLKLMREVQDLLNLLRQKMEKYYSPKDTIKTFPAYFNPGCCTYKDGEITGIEIAGGQIGLVKWTKDSGNSTEFSRMVLEEDAVANLFSDFNFQL